MNSPTHKLGKRFKRERERHELHKEKKTIATNGHLKTLISRAGKKIAKLISGIWLVTQNQKHL